MEVVDEVPEDRGCGRTYTNPVKVKSGREEVAKVADRGDETEAQVPSHLRAQQ